MLRAIWTRDVTCEVKSLFLAVSWGNGKYNCTLPFPPDCASAFFVSVEAIGFSSVIDVIVISEDVGRSVREFGVSTVEFVIGGCSAFEEILTGVIDR